MRALVRIGQAALVALAAIAAGVTIAMFVPAVQQPLLFPGALLVNLLAGLSLVSANDRADVILLALIFDCLLIWGVAFIVLQVRAAARERRRTVSADRGVS